MTGNARTNFDVKMRAEPNCIAAISFRSMGKFPRIDNCEGEYMIITTYLV